MDLNLIKKLIKILETSTITDLEIEENDYRIKISKKVRTLSSVDHSHAIHNVQSASEGSQIDVQVEKTAKEEEAEKKSAYNPLPHSWNLLQSSCPGC